MQVLAFGRDGIILQVVEFKFRAKLELIHATSDTFSSPTWGDGGRGIEVMRDWNTA